VQESQLFFNHFTLITFAKQDQSTHITGKYAQSWMLDKIYFLN